MFRYGFNVQIYAFSLIWANLQKNFRSFHGVILAFVPYCNLWGVLNSVSAGDFVRGYLRFARFFNVNVRQWAVNERQCFLCGQWCAMSVNGLARSVAVKMVVNGVLRTLWARIACGASSIHSDEWAIVGHSCKKNKVPNLTRTG